MSVSRTLFAVAAAAAAVLPLPAAAQFFFKPADLTGTPVTGAEPGVVSQALPDATPEELRAALVWNLRAGLNVAALQCQFEPTLLTLSNYNALLFNHKDELAGAYTTLDKYFARTSPNAKAGQTALDQFGTRVYASFSVVSAQLTFCDMAGRIGQEAVFTPRGELGELAQRSMRGLRNALVAYGEQQFRDVVRVPPLRFRQFDNPRCWRRAQWQEKRCGAFPYA